MKTIPCPFALAALAATLTSPVLAEEAARSEMIARGEYLVTVSGCTDCHTPGYLLGAPDHSRHLAGSEVGFELPGLGVFYGPNLTSDPETGLGRWTRDEIVAAITTGSRPDGRQLAPAMPWMAYAYLTPEDAAAIADYLASLPAVSNAVPGPFGPNEAPTSFVMRVIPPGG